MFPLVQTVSVQFPEEMKGRVNIIDDLILALADHPRLEDLHVFSHGELGLRDGQSCLTRKCAKTISRKFQNLRVLRLGKK